MIQKQLQRRLHQRKTLAKQLQPQQLQPQQLQLLQLRHLSQQGVTMEQLAGTYAVVETLSPQEFYGEYYDAEICKTTVKAKTIYKFDANGNFTTYITFENEATIRAEYKAIMVKEIKAQCEASEVPFDDDMKTYAEESADSIMDMITEPTTAKYEIDGNKLVYTIDGYEMYETFELDGNKLTLTGSSEGDMGYPHTLIKQ